MTPKPLTMFGREMKRTSDGDGWTLDLGLFSFDIWDETSLPSASFYYAALRLRTSSTPIVNCHRDTEEQCRDWIESEARRIAREMVEMAAPQIELSHVPPTVVIDCSDKDNPPSSLDGFTEPGKPWKISVTDRARVK